MVWWIMPAQAREGLRTKVYILGNAGEFEKDNAELVGESESGIAAI